MNFVSTRIITADVRRLVAFYEEMTGTRLTLYTEDFAELITAAGTLAIGSTRTLQLFGGDHGIRQALPIRASIYISVPPRTPLVSE